MEYVQQHLRGHFQYFGVSGNIRGLQRYLYASCRLLFKWLNRRSQRRSMGWDRFNGVMRLILPRPRIFHNLYPDLLRKPPTGSQMV
jgi:RNA-directed DNA polymerase